MGRQAVAGRTQGLGWWWEHRKGEMVEVALAGWLQVKCVVHLIRVTKGSARGQLLPEIALESGNADEGKQNTQKLRMIKSLLHSESWLTGLQLNNQFCSHCCKGINQRKKILCFLKRHPSHSPTHSNRWLERPHSFFSFKKKYHCTLKMLV